MKLSPKLKKSDNFGTKKQFLNSFNLFLLVVPFIDGLNHIKKTPIHKLEKDHYNFTYE
jgi:hypothetical protein